MDSSCDLAYPCRVPSLHALANPARFLAIARPLTPVLFWAGVALIAVGVGMIEFGGGH